MGDEEPRRFGVVVGRGIGEVDDVATRLLGGVVLDGRLPRARVVDHPDSGVVVVADDLSRAVGAAVQGHEDLQAIGRIVELEGVFDLPGDVLFFVVGGDEDRKRGAMAGIDLHRSAEHVRECDHHGRQDDEVEQDEGESGPEHDFHACDPRG